MGLLEEAKTASKLKRPQCSVAKLDDGLRAEVDEALELLDDGVTGEGVSKALESRGVNIKAGTLRRHARGGCSCESP